MESLTSRQAADQLGVSVQKFHRLMASEKVAPVMEAPGLRGAKFWNARDIERVQAGLVPSEAVA